jgi:hypothetical protein
LQTDIVFMLRISYKGLERWKPTQCYYLWQPVDTMKVYKQSGKYGCDVSAARWREKSAWLLYVLSYVQIFHWGMFSPYRRSDLSCISNTAQWLPDAWQLNKCLYHSFVSHFPCCRIDTYHHTGIDMSSWVFKGNVVSVILGQTNHHHSTRVLLLLLLLLSSS